MTRSATSYTHGEGVTTAVVVVVVVLAGIDAVGSNPFKKAIHLFSKAGSFAKTKHVYHCSNDSRPATKMNQTPVQTYL